MVEIGEACYAQPQRIVLQRLEDGGLGKAFGLRQQLVVNIDVRAHYCPSEVCTSIPLYTHTGDMAGY